MEHQFIETISFPSMTLRLDSEGIVHVRYLEGQTIDEKEKLQEYEAAMRITKGVPHPFIFSFESYVTVTKRAKELSIEIEMKQPFLVVAIIVDNMAYQILADFYFKIYKPKVFCRVFKSPEKATKWLIQMKDPVQLERARNHVRKIPFFQF
jgi:hypothetical protein